MFFKNEPRHYVSRWYCSLNGLAHRGLASFQFEARRYKSESVLKLEISFKTCKWTKWIQF